MSTLITRFQMEVPLMTYDTCLYRGSKEGSVNNSMYITYVYMFEDDPDNFPTVKVKRNGGLIIQPSFAITISEGFDKNRIFIPGMRYYSFVSLLSKAVTAIQENLFKLFPNVTSTEFEVDSRALELFQTEKALSTAGMQACPAVWANSVDECFPGVKISNKYGEVIIPLEDAIPIVEMLKRFDPIVYSVSMLELFGKAPENTTNVTVTNQPINEYKPVPSSNVNV